MAYFTAKEWKNRLVEFAGRRILANVSTGEQSIVDVTRNEGQVSQEGDAFSPANMNGLEQRVADGFAAAETDISTLNRELTASGAIDHYDVLEDGVYITYTLPGGADPVQKKLGSGAGFLVEAGVMQSGTEYATYVNNTHTRMYDTETFYAPYADGCMYLPI